MSPPPPPERMAVLLVDDERGFVEVLAKRLGRRNIGTDAALSGAEALRMAGEREYDLVVMDLRMEGMDGLETLRSLHETDPELPVFMLTGHGSVESAREAAKAGAADYLAKPCDFEELVARIRAAGRRERRRDGND